MVPDNGAMPVNDKDIGIGITGSGVVHPILLNDFRCSVIQHRELQPQGFYCEAGLRKVIHTDGQYFRVQVGELAVLTLQLPELRTAVSSPESPVEHHDDIFVASI